MKRPLRFLVHKLDLNEEVAFVVADALNDFRIEKAQYDVDKSRAKKTLTEALKHAELNDDALNDAAEASVEALKKLQIARIEALKRIHAVLDDTQRQKLAVVLSGVGFDL